MSQPQRVWVRNTLLSELDAGRPGGAYTYPGAMNGYQASCATVMDGYQALSRPPMMMGGYYSQGPNQIRI